MRRYEDNALGWLIIAGVFLLGFAIYCYFHPETLR